MCRGDGVEVECLPTDAEDSGLIPGAFIIFSSHQFSASATLTSDIGLLYRSVFLCTCTNILLSVPILCPSLCWNPALSIALLLCVSSGGRTKIKVELSEEMKTRFIKS